MKQKPVLLRLALALGFSSFLILCFAFRAIPGGDVYQIYLNDQLLLKQIVHEPVSLKSISLDNAKPSDLLKIYYSHCGEIGKGRSVRIVNKQGAIVKKWDFSSSKDAAMIIPVKDVQQLKSSGEELSLYYQSNEIPKGKMLAAVRHQSANSLTRN